MPLRELLPSVTGSDTYCPLVSQANLLSRLQTAATAAICIPANSEASSRCYLEKDIIYVFLKVERDLRMVVKLGSVRLNTHCLSVLK